jgi:hypothetical protein
MTDIVGDSLGGERNETRPAPLVPRDAVLQDFRFLPIDIGRLFGSRFHAIASDAEWRAGVTLWLKSYHQTPAGSLPNDDIELARLAEFGRNLKKFLKIKKIALHGWIECADGRLYHRVVAEKVNEAWTRKQMQRERSRKGNAKRWGSEAKHNEGSAHYATSDAVVSSPPRTPSGIPQASYEDAQRMPQASPKDASRMSQWSPEDASSILQASLKHPKGQGQRQGQRQGEKTISAEPSRDVSTPAGDVFLTLPLVDGSEHPVTQADIAFWTETYPAVDVPQAFRGMRAWLTTNGTRRKTRRGIARFVNAWLEREQNCGRVGPPKQPTSATERHEQRRANALRWAQEMMAKEVNRE